MKYYLFLDDSGQLHPNYPYGNYFVYGGLLVNEKNFHKINKAYKKLVKQVKYEKKIEDELKTSSMDNSTRRRLLNALAGYNCTQVFVSVHVLSMIRLDFENKRDVVRYKNYMIRRLIDVLINNNVLDKSCSLLEVNIDNQNVAHSSLNGLEDHLNNYFNEDDFYHVHMQKDTTKFNCDFIVNYKDSKKNYLIQAVDLLANTMYLSLNIKADLKRLLKNDYIHLNLP